MTLADRLREAGMKILSTVHRGSLDRTPFPDLAEDFTCKMLMRRRAKLLVRHHTRKDFPVAFHAVDEQLIKHPFQTG